jgi:hypothetical protein
MAELTRDKRAESGVGTTQAQGGVAVDRADARSGRLAASRELRGLGLDAVSEALAGGPKSAKAEAPNEQRSTRGALDGGDGAETSPLPADEMQKEIDRVVQEANEEDAQRQAEGGGGEGGEGAAPGAGGGAPASGPAAPASAGLQAPAAVEVSRAPVNASASAAPASAVTATSARAAAPQPSAKSKAIIVQGRSIGEGEAIPGTFQASSGFGAAMARSGHAMGCIHCMAGTNSWAKPGGFPGTLGLTTVRNAFTGPKFEIETSARAKPSSGADAGGPGGDGGGSGSGPGGPPPEMEWVATVKSTTSTDATHPCVSSPAGDHKTGTTMVNVKGVPTSYETFLQITAGYAAKIWAAEDEHLADALRAYQISLQAAETEVNKLAQPGKEWVADTKENAELGPKGALQGVMPAKLGIDPTTWRSAVWSLCLLTISGRDNLGYHTFYTSASAPDHANKKVVSTLTDGTTQIGSHSSSAVVDLSKI